MKIQNSFGCSLFVGRYAPIDYADGSAMNLLDIKNKTWSNKCLQTIDGTEPTTLLLEKLGQPIPSDTIVGYISEYFCKTFGFNQQCKVYPFTGDNPSSLVGMCLGEQDIGMSLGTSDTIFIRLKYPQLLEHGHLLISPVNHQQYMALVCYRNGSLVRERMKDEFCRQGNGWQCFNELLEATPIGNHGFIGLYFDVKEIFPNIVGHFRYDEFNKLIDKFPTPEIEVRALIEGQFLSRRALLEHLQIPIVRGQTNIIVTGGASKNKSILQVISDIFGCDVYNMEYSNSAALGAAYRAANFIDNAATANHNNHLRLVCKPYQPCYQIYTEMVTRYNHLLKKISTLL